ncbi:urease accessory protein UreD [Granulosicoccus sp.]|nr:urease accessory protein UreD [Granulosicoccus sp.]
MREPVRQRINAAARVSAKPVDGVFKLPGPSTIDELYQQGSARIRFPRTEPGALQAVLINTAGGLTGDDHIQWTASAAPSAHLSVSTAACEKIYRTHGPAATQSTTLNVASHARLEWLPQESIVFNGASLNRTMHVHLEDHAEALIGESLIFGRQAMQESTNKIIIHDRWRIYRAGRLQHAEDLHVDTGIDDHARRACMLHHYSAISTLVLLCDKPDEWFCNKQSRLRAIPCAAPEHVSIGVSVLPSRLVIRVLASDSFQLRKILIPCIELLNDGRPLPTVWKV